MELLALVAILVIVGILAITSGSDSRSTDDRPWWPANPGETGYPQHHA